MLSGVGVSLAGGAGGGGVVGAAFVLFFFGELRAFAEVLREFVR
jgi:proteasome assembly chaperone (PAC2) family protein